MGKRVIIFGTIAALLLAGCGKKAPTSATPIAVGTTTGVTSPALATGTSSVVAPTDTTSTPQLGGDTTPADTTGIDPAATAATAITASSAPKATPTPGAAVTSTPTATPTVTPTATPTPQPTATPTPAPTATPTPAPTATPTPAPTPTPTPNTSANTPQFVKDIGNGSLNSSHGIAASNGFIYVVDNARMGLLGHYAAVRKYAVADGSYSSSSFDSIGWDGLKHLPTTVTAVKLVAGDLVAADSATAYTFSMDASFVLKAAGGFSAPTSVVDPKTGDTYKINGGQIDRLHNGFLVVSFGIGTLSAPESIACSEDGTIFVTESTKGLVHQFAAPTN